jgi:hypothetical protein
VVEELVVDELAVVEELVVDELAVDDELDDDDEEVAPELVDAVLLDVELVALPPWPHAPFTQTSPLQHPAAQLWPSMPHAVHTSLAQVPLQHSENAAHACPPGLQTTPLLLVLELAFPPPEPVLLLDDLVAVLPQAAANASAISGAVRYRVRRCMGPSKERRTGRHSRRKTALRVKQRGRGGRFARRRSPSPRGGEVSVGGTRWIVRRVARPK